jgi:RNA polymerase sigma-70 factor (ECF subfamily)
VRWALSQLTEVHREVIELGVFQDLPYAEISEILSIPVGTVKSRMSNALKKLKEVFDERRS